MTGLSRIVRTAHRNRNCSIGIDAVPRPFGHTVYHNATLLGCRRYNAPSRTHTEGIDTARKRGIRKGIFRRAQKRMPCGIPIAHPVNVSAQMLNPYPDRNRLLLHGKALVEKQQKGITRTVSRCQKQRASPQSPLRRRNGKCPVRIFRKIIHPAPVPHNAAAPDDFFEYIVNNKTQNIRSDMRLCLCQNIFGRPEPAELLQNVSTSSVIDSCQKFSVGKGSGTTGTVLNIAFRIEHLPRRKLTDTLCSVRNIAAAVNQDRVVPFPRKQQCGKQPRRSHANHHRRRSQSARSLSDLQRGCFQFADSFTLQERSIATGTRR
ncbi:unknown [Clostridium sp. CAG:448]|nr:unknown [Clostridium sp. CAG:448]